MLQSALEVRDLVISNSKSVLNAQFKSTELKTFQVLCVHSSLLKCNNIR